MNVVPSLRRPPLGWRPYLGFGAAIAVVVLLGNSSAYGWPYQWWSDTSAAFHQRLDLAGPVAAFGGAYVAGRLTPPDRMFSLPGSSRDPFAYAASQLLPLGAAGLAGYLAGMSPLLALTASTATYGTVDIPVALTGVLGLALFLVLGWALGALARTALVAPLASTLAFVATFAGYGGDRYAAVLPVLHVTPFQGYEQAEPLTHFRLGFFLAAAVATLWATTSMLRRRTFGRRWPGPMLLVGIPFLALVGHALTSTPALWAVDTSAAGVCRPHGGIEYCVHQGNVSQLPGLIDSVAPVLARYGVANAPFGAVHDMALRHTAGTDVVERTYYYDLGPGLPASSTVSELADSLAGMSACHRKYRATPGAPGMVAASELSDRLVGGGAASGTDPQDPDEELLRDWISGNGDAIARCATAPDELP